MENERAKCPEGVTGGYGNQPRFKGGYQWFSTNHLASMA